jgi:PKD repeat protein
MRKIHTLILILFISATATYFNQAKACYANFNHTNACVGDTVWFYGLDLNAVHAWNFGDSIPSNPNLMFGAAAYHVYTTAGTYYVTHFVNIGAEWAFETQEVTVGTNCFMAEFDVRCSSDFFMNFINQSVGNNLSYLWNFGEPSSGSYDTSTAFNPTHSYSVIGNYMVTLIISDGNFADTIVHPVTIDSSCMSATISYMMNPCAGDSTILIYNFYGVNAVYWDFGDPASGINNYSTLMTPTHIFATPGIYVGMVIYTNGINTDTLPVVTNVVDCNVWPGDANRDGGVTGEDLFAIALNYGDTGTVRNNASTNFISQPAINWTNSMNFNYMYLQDLVDKKYADCNGDGVIDSADVAVVIQNFGMIHEQRNNLSSMMFANTLEPHLSVALPLSVSNSSTIVAELNYGDSTMHGSIYGICAYIEYNPNQVDEASIVVDFSGSFLDSINVSNLITWWYADINHDRIIIVESRKDKTGMDGYGMNLAHISFNTTQGYIGPLTLHISQETKVMSNSPMIGSSYGYVQNFLTVNTDDGSTQVSLGISDVNGDHALIVYPTPTKDIMHLIVNNAKGEYSIHIFDAMGRAVFEKDQVANNQLIDLRSLPGGFYFLQVEGKGWRSNSKLIIGK